MLAVMDWWVSRFGMDLGLIGRLALLLLLTFAGLGWQAALTVFILLVVIPGW